MRVLVIYRNWGIRIFCWDGLIIILRRMVVLVRLKIWVRIWVMDMGMVMFCKMLHHLCLKIIMNLIKIKELFRRYRHVRDKVLLLLLDLKVLLLVILDWILYYVLIYLIIDMDCSSSNRNRLFNCHLSHRLMRVVRLECLKIGLILRV